MAEVVLFMLTRPRGMTIRDVVTVLPTNFDLWVNVMNTMLHLGLGRSTAPTGPSTCTS